MQNTRDLPARVQTHSRKAQVTTRAVRTFLRRSARTLRVDNLYIFDVRSACSQRTKDIRLHIRDDNSQNVNCNMMWCNRIKQLSQPKATNISYLYDFIYCLRSGKCFRVFCESVRRCTASLSIRSEHPPTCGRLQIWSHWARIPYDVQSPANIREPFEYLQDL